MKEAIVTSSIAVGTVTVGLAGIIVANVVRKYKAKKRPKYKYSWDNPDKRVRLREIL